MATNRTKEEQQLLDEKIARIQKKNEEILRRQKEIEEDKRLAEQQNALVKLRPSTVNTSRERTPALKPSKRELKEDFSDDIEVPVIQRNTRGSFRGRGGERYRGQGDWKTNGPPPDPKSFLYDDERDRPERDRDGKGDLRKELDRRRTDERDVRDENRGAREFQRGGRRGGVEYRSERGRRVGAGRGRGGRNEEEAWRAERMRIDEARIQRQKSADGKWRREWDNEKILQDHNEDHGYESRRTTSSNEEQWDSPSRDHHQHHHQHQHHHHQHQHQHNHQCEMHDFRRGGHHHHSPHKCPNHFQQSPPSRQGRGRGRLDPAELEKPIDNIPIEVLQQRSNPRTNPDYQMHHTAANASHPSLSPTHQDNFQFGTRRTIECMGSTVKISIPNTSDAQSPPKAQRKINESRGRFRSQTSYSSQSDEDSPRDRGQRGGRRQRNQKYPKTVEKTSSQLNTTNTRDNCTENSSAENVHAQNKPPLPPFKSSQIPLTSPEDKEEDGSWEDVTTSGAESMGEELSSVHSSPGKSIPNIAILNSEMKNDLDAFLDQTSFISLSQSLNNTVVDESVLDSRAAPEVEIKSLTVSEGGKITTKAVNDSEMENISSGLMKEIELNLELSTLSINDKELIPNDEEMSINRTDNTVNEENIERDSLLRFTEKEIYESNIEENVKSIENTTQSDKNLEPDSISKSHIEKDKADENVGDKDITIENKTEQDNNEGASSQKTFDN